MTVDTAKVTGRRELHFEWIDEILDEAERIAAASQVRTLGNWSPGQIMQHLAAGMHVSIDGSPHRPPWYLRLVGPLVKRRVLTKGMSPGFQLRARESQSQGAAEVITTESGLAALREAIRRMRREAHREPHVFFGKLTYQEWEQLHLRHAELHFSFLLPEPASVKSAAD